MALADAEEAINVHNSGHLSDRDIARHSHLGVGLLLTIERADFRCRLQ
jgi:hypothetical protein